MKKFLCFLSVLMVLTFTCVSAFATQIEDAFEEEEVTIGEDTESGTVGSGSTFKVQNPEIIEESSELVDFNVSSYALNSANTQGLKSIILSLIGDYEVTITDYEYRNSSSSYTSHSIDIEPDYVWLTSMALFTIVIYCLFRIGGAVLD